ncbi:MAG: DUF1848 domain-containing protein [Desulfovibrio sp.]
MIISASRRTDLPALYAPWLLNRARAGWCAVPNPFNARQVSRISLRPEHVDAMIFWSRWPAPLAARLEELEALGLGRSMFLITLLDSPRMFEPRQPPLRKRMEAFLELAKRIGPERVVWRYDPIVFSSLTPPEWHARTFARLAGSLRKSTRRCIVSFLDIYKKMRPRLRLLREQGLDIPENQKQFAEMLLPKLAVSARANGMTLQTCAQAEDWSALGAPAGACVDATYLNETFGLSMPPGMDPHQRSHCGCAPSRDIGMYDSCTQGCFYCYATSDFARSRAQRAAHDPDSPSLLGHFLPTGSATGPRSATQVPLPGLEPDTGRSV